MSVSPPTFLQYVCQSSNTCNGARISLGQLLPGFKVKLALGSSGLHKVLEQGLLWGHCIPLGWYYILSWQVLHLCSCCMLFRRKWRQSASARQGTL